MFTVDPALQQLTSDRVAALHETAERVRNARRVRFLTRFAPRRSRLRLPAVSSGAIPGVARPPAPFTDTFGAWAEHLGTAVSEHGIERFERAVSRLVKVANRYCLSPDLVAVVADRSEPPVARERALGIVLVELAGRAVSTAPRADRDVA